MKYPGLFFVLELQPYRYGLVVSIGQTDKQVRRSMERVDKDCKTKRTADVVESLKSGWPGFVRVWEADSFLYVREMPVTVQAQGVVIHELLHAVRHCLQTRNIRMGGINGQETYCYLLEETWNEVMGRVARHIAKHDKKIGKSKRR